MCRLESKECSRRCGSPRDKAQKGSLRRCSDLGRPTTTSAQSRFILQRSQGPSCPFLAVLPSLHSLSWLGGCHAALVSSRASYDALELCVGPLLLSSRSRSLTNLSLPSRYLPCIIRGVRAAPSLGESFSRFARRVDRPVLPRGCSPCSREFFSRRPSLILAALGKIAPLCSLASLGRLGSRFARDTFFSLRSGLVLAVLGRLLLAPLGLGTRCTRG